MSTPEPYWSDEDVTLYLGDCLAVMRTLEADSVDAIVTDPPAAVSFMGRTWDSDRGGRGQWVAWLAERLEAAARVLKPGGHLLVWSLPRTSHWTAWALEDAGLEIRDCILHLFGSGFPKSLDVSKAIDKRAEENIDTKRRIAAVAEVIRAHREAKGMTPQQVSLAVVGTPSGACWNWEHQQLPSVEMWPAIKAALGIADEYDALIEGDRAQFIAAERATIGRRLDGAGNGSVIGLGSARSMETEYDVTTPATEAAKRWEGFGTALKPGQEMWWLARKPMKGTVAANVLEFGTGALNIAACLVAHASAADLATSQSKNPGRDDTVTSGTYGADRPQQSVNTDGRWPTNIVFTHSQSCEPIGTREVRNHGHGPASRGSGGISTSGHGGQEGLTERRVPLETVDAWNCAPDCPVAELDRQSGSVKSSGIYSPVDHGPNGNAKATTFPTPGTPGTMYGDSGGASRFYPVFRYQAKAPASERPRLDDGSAHETVKPLGLVRFLVRLICPPGGTVLDPFCGSGVTGEAAIVEGFHCILIDQDPKSAELAKARLRKPIQPVMFGFDEAS